MIGLFVGLGILVLLSIRGVGRPGRRGPEIALLIVGVASIAIAVAGYLNLVP